MTLFPVFFQIAESIFVALREDKQGGTVLEKAWVFHDADGDFEVKNSGRTWWFGTTTYWKEYIDGSAKGLKVYISYPEYQTFQEVGRKLWGYFNRWGDFVPGTKRQTLPIFDEFQRIVGYWDKEAKHLLSRPREVWQKRSSLN